MRGPRPIRRNTFAIMFVGPWVNKHQTTGLLAMRLIAFLVVSLLPAVAVAEDVRPKPANIDTAIERGAGFLARDAVAWKKEHKCVSCHHAGLVVWALRETKQSGRSVDE